MCLTILLLMGKYFFSDCTEFLKNKLMILELKCFWSNQQKALKNVVTISITIHWNFDILNPDFVWLLAIFYHYDNSICIQLYQDIYHFHWCMHYLCTGLFLNLYQLPILENNFFQIFRYLGPHNVKLNCR